MNCLELRRAVMLDPRRPDAAMLEHAAGCELCREFLERARALEAEMDSALRVAVPPGMHARVIAAAIDGPRRSRRLALAAGVALGLAAGTGAWLWRRDDPLALAGIDFVVFEEAQAILDAKPVEPEALAAVLRQIGVALPDQLGEMRYVGTCPFGGGMAHHVVAKTMYGKVTLLLMPGRSRSERGEATARGLQALVAPASGGCVAIIADSTRSLKRTETMLMFG